MVALFSPPSHRPELNDTPTVLSRYTRALLPDFELQREIGRGGMGIVYLGVDVKLDRPVAVKVLPEELAAAPGVRERFLREARTAAKLSHPNIVPIYRADELDGVAFFVMEFVDGPSLAERLAECGLLSALEAAPHLLARHLFRRTREKRDIELRALVNELAAQIASPRALPPQQ